MTSLVRRESYYLYIFIYIVRTIIDPVTNFTVIAYDINHPPADTATLKWCPQDLNANHRGKYVYVGVHYEIREPPVTTIDFLIQDYGEPRTPAGWKSCNVDLNSGAGGKFIYLIWKTGESEKKPIIKIKFVETQNHSPPEIVGWTAIHKDLCAGAGGSFMFAYYQLG